MKKLMLVLLIGFMLSMFLTACSGGDGINTVYLPYQEDGSTQNLGVLDKYGNNGIYIDVVNKQIYCTKGPDTIIKLPDSMKDYLPGSNYDLSIDVEYVCKLGQKAFDNDMITLGISAP